MNKKIHFFVVAALFAFSTCSQNLPGSSYVVDVTQNLDTFQISLSFDKKLKKEDSIFQFAATAPGTYQTMNIGRFVSGFTVLDKKGDPITSERLSQNQFVISKPQDVQEIRYFVAETFDTPVKKLPIYLMAGSSIEADHSLINAHTMLGYIPRLQAGTFRIKVNGGSEWGVGTALSKDDEDYFVAESYDQLVDSPILTGRLTKADTMISNTKVEVYTYSQSDLISSSMLLGEMGAMLRATEEFLVTLPVDRYTFLYFFEKGLQSGTGAWEHSYSSEYVMPELEPDAAYMKRVTDIASHEFFHIVTPLNIHSEIIEKFDFVKPTPSVHLWMYEGVTEWASNVLLYRGGVVLLDEYMDKSLAEKILVSEKYFDSSWSLKKLSDESFKGGMGAQQYGNIYYKGSLVAGLLDIRLLELSKGTYGLRELLLDLIEKYGKGKPVSEATFFDDLAEMTYPEIRDFFDKYVLASEGLPYVEYFSKIGLQLERTESGLPVVKKLKTLSADQKMLFEAWSNNLPRN